MALFGHRDDEAAGGDIPSAAAEISRLEALPLADLAAEVMERGFGPDGPGAPGRPGTIEAPELSAPRVRLNEVAGAVTPAYAASNDATDQLRIANLVAEAVQALELAALIRVDWRGGTENVQATRRGRAARSAGEVKDLVARALG
ncbi:MAG TPA: hypothetical protein VN671_05810 [Solirubrobacterales bacterium]|nr:hypothetical protein [Solirubrobacterales bacterium]